MTDPPSIIPANIDGAFRPNAKAHITSAVVDDVAVLYDESYGVCHRLDPVATVIWSLLDGNRTIDQLVDRLAESYASDRSTIEADVLTFVRHLGDLGVLEGVARGDPES